LLVALPTFTHQLFSCLASSTHVKYHYRGIYNGGMKSITIAHQIFSKLVR
jgi:hypothetical protein